MNLAEIMERLAYGEALSVREYIYLRSLITRMTQAIAEIIDSVPDVSEAKLILEEVKDEQETE